MKIRFTLVIGILLGAAAAWGAEPSTTLTEHAAALNRAAQTPAGEQVVLQRLSQELGLPVSTLQSQHEQTGLGWGELLIANRLAQQTGLPFSQIVGEFRSGQGWGQIARQHGLNLGELVSEVKEAREAIEAQAQRTDHSAPGITTEPGTRGREAGPAPIGPGFGGMGGRGSHGGRGR